MVSTTSPLRAPRSNFKRESAGDRRQFKPKPWSHQGDLTAAKGKRVEIFFNPDDALAGILLEADQFALKLEVVNSDGTYKSVLTVFKHSIRFFRVA
jgi:hypothetical protein